jgi:hypothetical protein
MMDAEQILDFLVDAEAGNYGWFEYEAIPSANVAEKQGIVHELDEYGDVVWTHVFNQADIVRGIEREALRQGLSVVEFMDNYDASDADNAVQWAVLGEIRYA